MSELERIRTRDGSFTFYHPLIGEHYHSIHGALQESRHVFVDAGARYFLNNHPGTTSLKILEVGLGTALNFLLTADYCAGEGIPLHYTAIEKYPLSAGEIRQTGYQEFLADRELAAGFYARYQSGFSGMQDLGRGQCLEICQTDIRAFESSGQFDVLYFDAFAAVHQPEMWEKPTLERVCRYLRPGGVFVTYAITGQLKRDMKSLGFEIEKLPGAPGKREMLRAVRSASPSYRQNAHNNPADPL